MCKKMNVSLDQKVVGTVEIQKKGLYYQINCRCAIPAGKVYRLQAVCDRRVVDFGICVPFEDGFGVDKRIPAKQLDVANISFHLSTNRSESDMIFVPLDTMKPFDSLENIMDAKFERRDGVAGLLFKKVNCPQ